MCGIVGYIDFSKNTNLDHLEKMVSSLGHRGPDASSFRNWDNVNYTVGLGHTRLSIIDLSSEANQPMVRDDLSLAIIFNGEIYNFKEIKKELILNNYNFKTNSDTEVLLVAFHLWGIECLNRLNGMFAFTIYDSKNNELFIARDRVGVKPLYYYQTNDLFLFSSELKSFHHHPRFKKIKDNNSVASFLKLGFIPAPHTIFNDCYKLDAGSYLTINLKNKDIRKAKYWDVTNFFSEEKSLLSEKEILDDIEELLVSSFKFRMIADVPVGVFLSGGYDSSTVAAIIQANSEEKINTYSIGFGEEKFNEAPFAKAIANHIGSNHNELYCSVDDAKSLIELIPKIYDEPFGDSSAIPTLLVSKFASEQVKVVLSGDGGDEIFCGYGKYFEKIHQFNKIANIKGFEKQFYNKLSGTLIKSGIIALIPELYANKIIKTKKVLNETDYREKYRHRIEPTHINELDLNKLLMSSFTNQKTAYDKINSHSKSASIIDILMSIDFQTNLVDDLLVKVDRASMAFGLEVREPLLDYRLIEYLAKVPSDLKFSNNIPKYLLRKITHKYIPKELLDRPKMGFAIPKEIWLKKELAKFTKEVILDTASSDVFNKKELEKTLRKYYRQDDSDSEKIWNLLMFQMWWKEWM
jgi:asparagine synthase (glutamine-hydrolysing)